MSKVIAAPEKLEILTDEGEPKKYLKNTWRGTIALYERFTLAQIEAIDKADDDIVAASKAATGKGIRFTLLDKAKLPAILLCVEKWNLTDFPETVTLETFPLTPRRTSHLFIDWVWSEIRAIQFGELEVPNE